MSRHCWAGGLGRAARNYHASELASEVDLQQTSLMERITERALHIHQAPTDVCLPTHTQHDIGTLLANTIIARVDE